MAQGLNISDAAKVQAPGRTGKAYAQPRNTSGMTIAEMLIAIAVLGLVTLGLVLGVSMSTSQFGKSMATSESQQLFSTLETVISNELRYTTRIDGPGLDPNKSMSEQLEAGVEYQVDSFFSTNYGNKNSLAYLKSLNSNGAVVDAFGQLALTSEDGTSSVNRLIGRADYNYDLGAKVESVTYQDGYFTVHLVVGKNSEGALVDEVFHVRALNLINETEGSGEGYFTVAYYNGESEFASYSVKDGQTHAVISDIPTDAAGRAFAGWNTSPTGSGMSYVAGELITQGTTLYAQWEEAKTIVVTFSAGEGASVEPTSMEVTLGKEYGSLPTPTRNTADGYAFAGWYTQPDGGGIKVTASTQVTIDEDHTLYAKWYKRRAYVGYFELDGASVTGYQGYQVDLSGDAAAVQEATQLGESNSIDAYAYGVLLLAEFYDEEGTVALAAGWSYGQASERVTLNGEDYVLFYGTDANVSNKQLLSKLATTYSYTWDFGATFAEGGSPAANQVRTPSQLMHLGWALNSMTGPVAAAVDGSVPDSSITEKLRDAGVSYTQTHQIALDQTWRVIGDFKGNYTQTDGLKVTLEGGFALPAVTKNGSTSTGLFNTISGGSLQMNIDVAGAVDATAATTAQRVGLLAANYSGGTLDSTIAVNGSLTLSAATVDATKRTDVGAFFGVATADVSGVTLQVNGPVTLNSTLDTTTKNLSADAGGLVGYASAAVGGTIEGSGALSVNATLSGNAENSNAAAGGAVGLSTSATPLAGVQVSADAQFDIAATNNSQTGNVDATAYGAHAGGLVGCANNDVTSLVAQTLPASLKVTATAGANNAHAGGVLGTAKSSISGVEVTIPSSSTVAVVANSESSCSFAGGALGFAQGIINGLTLDHYGILTVEGSSPEHQSYGGAVGDSRKAASNVTLHAYSGSIIVRNDATSAMGEGDLNVGGVIGCALGSTDGAASHVHLINDGADISLSAQSSSGLKGRTRAGGVVGTAAADGVIGDVSCAANAGTLTVAAQTTSSTSTNVAAGGVIGDCGNSKTAQAANDVVLDVSGGAQISVAAGGDAGTSAGNYAGGVVGYASYSLGNVALHASGGSLSVNGQASAAGAGMVSVGGVVGLDLATAPLADVTANVSGSAQVDVSAGSSSDYVGVGGLVGHTKGTLDQASLTVEGSAGLKVHVDETAGLVCAGGALGFAEAASSNVAVSLGGTSSTQVTGVSMSGYALVGGVAGNPAALTNAKLETSASNVAIEGQGVGSSETCAGGLVGRVRSASSNLELDVSDGSMTVKGATTGAKAVCVGGAAGSVAQAVDGLAANVTGGNLAVEGQTANESAITGGLFGRFAGAVAVTNAQVKVAGTDAALSVMANATGSGKSAFAAGVFGYANNSTCSVVVKNGQPLVEVADGAQVLLGTSTASADYGYAGGVVGQWKNSSAGFGSSGVLVAVSDGAQMEIGLYDSAVSSYYVGAVAGKHDHALSLEGTKVQVTGEDDNTHIDLYSANSAAGAMCGTNSNGDGANKGHNLLSAATGVRLTNALLDGMVDTAGAGGCAPEGSVMRLYPKVNFTVEFDANGGTGSVASQTAVAGSTITLPDQGSLERTGYTFDGWATSADGPKAYDVGDSFTVNDNTTLYAHWVERTYTVTFDANGGTATPASLSVNYDAMVPEDSLVSASLSNKRVEGWYSGSNRVLDADGTLDASGAVASGLVAQNGSSYTWKLTQDATLKAQWSACKVTLSYHGQTAEKTITDAGLLDGYGSASSYQYGGGTTWELIGWYSAADSSGVKVLDANGNFTGKVASGITNSDGSAFDVSEDITLYAKYGKKSSTVYTLVDTSAGQSIATGDSYLILNRNTAGSAAALTNSSNFTKTGVTVGSGATGLYDSDESAINGVYVTNVNTSNYTIWTVESSGGSVEGSYYLRDSGTTNKYLGASVSIFSQSLNIGTGTNNARGWNWSSNGHFYTNGVIWGASIGNCSITYSSNKFGLTGWSGSTSTSIYAYKQATGYSEFSFNPS